MKNWLGLGVGLISCLARAESLPLVDGEEVFLIALNSKLLTELVNKPILERAPICEQIGRAKVEGCTETRGVVTAGPVRSKEAMAFELILNSVTKIDSTLTTDGLKQRGETGTSHPEIGAQFGMHVTSTAKTTKGVLLREDGFAFFKAATDAASLMDGMTTPVVQAQGLLPGRRMELGPQGWKRVNPRGQGALPIPGRALFPGLRLEQAQAEVAKEARAQKITTEQKSSKQVSESLNKQFDKTVYEALLPLHVKYQAFLYRPFIQGSLLGGRLGLGSDENWLAIRGTRGDKPVSLTPSEIPGLNPTLTEPILMRMHPEFIERIAELRIGGTVMTEVEAAEMMGYVQPDDETIENVVGEGEKEVEFVFDEIKPIKIRFAEDIIWFSYRMSEAKSLGKTLQNIQVTRAIEIVRGNDGSLSLLNRLPQPVAFYDGSIVPGELGRHITRRFSRFINKEAIKISTKSLFAEVKPMAIKAMTTLDNRLTVGLAPLEQVGGAK